MENCIFCKIIKGEIPCYKIYEDHDFLGFLDINPRVKGHTLLIPKKHYQWVYDVPNFSQYWLTVLKVTQIIKQTLNPYFINYLTYGLDIPHAHIHILPRKENDYGIFPEPITLSKEEMEQIANKIFKRA